MHLRSTYYSGQIGHRLSLGLSMTISEGVIGVASKVSGKMVDPNQNKTALSPAIKMVTILATPRPNHYSTLITETGRSYYAGPPLVNKICRGGG